MRFVKELRSCFFSVWTVFTILGLLLAVIGRGVIIQPSEKGWFSYAGLSDGKYNRQSIPLQVALGVWMGAHIASMWFMNSVSDVDRLGINFEDGYHGYIGFWPPFLTGIVALIVAYMVAERWFTRAMFVSSLWVLYQIGHGMRLAFGQTIALKELGQFGYGSASSLPFQS